MSRNTLSTRIGKKLAVLTQIAKERCMYKVHKQLRDVNEKAYEPVLLAIGPYNDHDKVGQGFMEEHKWCYLQQMLIKANGSVDTYIMALRGLEETARKCYEECINSQTSDEFVEMMLLDGCFIIELFRRHELYRETRELRDDPIFQMTWVFPRIARDLLLFENQLPFFVLAKLFDMSESNGSRNLGHVVDTEESDGISVESSAPTAQIIRTRLNDLAVSFFSDFLPFEWNVDASCYNSVERINNLLRWTHEALTPSLPPMVYQRLQVGFRFKNAEFEHLLGLIHASIGISILDTEIDHARERQEAGVKLKKAEIFTHLVGLICKVFIPLLAKMKNMRKANSSAREFQKSGSEVNMAENEEWESSKYVIDQLLEAGVELNMVSKFRDKLKKSFDWMAIVLHEAGIEFKKSYFWVATVLDEAGIEFNKAKKFKDILHDHNRNEDQKSKQSETGTQMDGVESKTVEKFKRLLCLDKFKNWKSIPYGKELLEATVEFNKAKKLKRLRALDEFELSNTHSATELEEAGIKFKKIEKSKSFLAITFNNGLMEISPLNIEDHTETYLRNLIAYEQYSYDEDIDFNYINHYVHFLDNLISSPKDVKLLRRRGIIRNYMGDDKVISTMVNKLCDNVSFSFRSSYVETAMEVNMHCRRQWNIRMAKLRRDYFNSPWALTSFLAAVLLIALAITQTIFSIIP